jgi:hypothetical protein
VSKIVPPEVWTTDACSRTLPSLRRERRQVRSVTAGVHEHKSVFARLRALGQLGLKGEGLQRRPSGAEGLTRNGRAEALPCRLERILVKSLKEDLATTVLKKP